MFIAFSCCSETSKWQALMKSFMTNRQETSFTYGDLMTKAICRKKDKIERVFFCVCVRDLFLVVCATRHRLATESPPRHLPTPALHPRLTPPHTAHPFPRKRILIGIQPFKMPFRQEHLFTHFSFSFTLIFSPREQR